MFINPSPARHPASHFAKRPFVVLTSKCKERNFAQWCPRPPAKQEQADSHLTGAGEGPINAPSASQASVRSATRRDVPTTPVTTPRKWTAQ